MAEVLYVVFHVYESKWPIWKFTMKTRVICMKSTHSLFVRLTAFKKAGNSGNITCSGPALTPLVTPKCYILLQKYILVPKVYIVHFERVTPTVTAL